MPVRGRLSYACSPGNFITPCIQVFQLLREVAEGSEEKIQYDDITSLYPYTQLVCPYPVGAHTPSSCGRATASAPAPKSPLSAYWSTVSGNDPFADKYDPFIC